MATVPPLMAFLLEYATDAERKVVREALDEGVWSGSDLFFADGPPDPAWERRLLAKRSAAEQVLTACLESALAVRPRRRVTALDATARPVEFGLGRLRGQLRFVDWSTGTLSIPPRERHPALYGGPPRGTAE